MRAFTDANTKLRDPNSTNYERPIFDKTSKEYGRPVPGTKTHARGIKAGGHVTREIIFLCELIGEINSRVSFSYLLSFTH